MPGQESHRLHLLILDCVVRPNRQSTQWPILSHINLCSSSAIEHCQDPCTALCYCHHVHRIGAWWIKCSLHAIDWVSVCVWGSDTRYCKSKVKHLPRWWSVNSFNSRSNIPSSLIYFYLMEWFHGAVWFDSLLKKKKKKKRCSGVLLSKVKSSDHTVDLRDNGFKCLTEK